MDSQTAFCPNLQCPAKGQVGQGNVLVHSRTDKRYKCKQCGKTFTQSKGTPFYRLRAAEELFLLVVTLLAHGCPVQAIVVAFSLDERTIYSWQARAGNHCQKVHEAVVETQQLAGEVQADELRVKAQAKVLWPKATSRRQRRSRSAMSRVLRRSKSAAPPCSQRFDHYASVPGSRSASSTSRSSAGPDQWLMANHDALLMTRSTHTRAWYRSPKAQSIHCAFVLQWPLE